MRTLLTHLLLATASAAAAAPARADFYIVASVGNPQSALTQKEAVDLFMGRNRAFATGDFATMVDLPRDHPSRTAFYRALTGMNAAQVNSYWARLMFSGQNMPPQALPDEAAVIDALKRNPHTLGWLSKEPADKQLRTLLVLKQ
jgi:hypothetical protein